MEALLDPLTVKKSAKKAQKRKPDAPPADMPAPRRSQRSNPTNTAPTTTTPNNEPLDQTPDDAPAPQRSRHLNPGYTVPTPTTTSDNEPLPEQMRTTATPDPPTTASATPPVMDSESPNQIPEGRSSLHAPQEGQLLPIGQDPAMERARQAGEALGTADLLACPASAPTWFVDVRGDITREGLGPHYNVVIAGVDSDGAGLAIQASGARSSDIHGGVAGVVGLVTARVETERGGWKDTEREGGEWGLLYHWGVNGVLSVIASLYFWGCTVRSGDPVLEASWEATVGDVGWMLEGMATYYEKFNERF
ncbi:hypothetical protein B0H14DRAFT_2572214 [Mycena olivaceomarginata]|nr:hypothetical protein B0H14DRAFT_2572214 [Mycena olivaceomarginata]